jgi:hypothetical protein
MRPTPIRSISQCVTLNCSANVRGAEAVLAGGPAHSPARPLTTRSTPIVARSKVRSSCGYRLCSENAESAFKDASHAIASMARRT